MYTIVRKADSTVREIAPSHHARNYVTKEISPGVSLAVNTAEDHDENETTAYDRIYYVISGELHVTIDSEENVIYPGDSMFISKGTTYQFGGTFESVVVNQPAFGV